MEAWQAVTLAVVALLVGALLPAVVQLTMALRALRATAAQAEGVLDAITATARRLDRLAARLEDGERIEHFLEGVDALSRTASHLLDGARLALAVGAAVGPSSSPPALRKRIPGCIPPLTTRHRWGALRLSMDEPSGAWRGPPYQPEAGPRGGDRRPGDLVRQPRAISRVQIGRSVRSDSRPNAGAVGREPTTLGIHGVEGPRILRAWLPPCA